MSTVDFHHPEIEFWTTSSCKLEGSINIRTYIYGGKGVVTLKSPTGKHHTYSFRYPVEENKFPEGTMFIYCMVRNGVWRYIGMYIRNKFRLTQMSRYGKDSSIVKGAQFIVRMMHKDFQTEMELYHEGVCSVCGRKLVTPKSIRMGIGPRCFKNLKSL